MLVRIMNDLGDTAQWITGAGIIVFFIQYTRYAKWWKNFIGRSVVMLDLCIEGILAPSLFTLAFPNLGVKYYASHWYNLQETVVLLVACYVVMSRIWGWEQLRRASGKPSLLDLFKRRRADEPE